LIKTKTVQAHPVKMIKEIKSEPKKSRILQRPEVFSDIIELGEKDSKKLVEKLREIYLESTDELETVAREEEEAKKKLEEVKKEIERVKDEKSRFQELYMNEVKKKNDLRSFIQTQKVLKKTQSVQKGFY
jgi:predicted nuclease with TOPRIM domain